MKKSLIEIKQKSSMEATKNKNTPLIDQSYLPYNAVDTDVL